MLNRDPNTAKTPQKEKLVKKPSKPKSSFSNKIKYSPIIPINKPSHCLVVKPFHGELYLL